MVANRPETPGYKSLRALLTPLTEPDWGDDSNGPDFESKRSRMARKRSRRRSDLGTYHHKPLQSVHRPRSKSVGGLLKKSVKRIIEVRKLLPRVSCPRCKKRGITRRRTFDSKTARAKTRSAKKKGVKRRRSTMNYKKKRTKMVRRPSLSITIVDQNDGSAPTELRFIHDSESPIMVDQATQTSCAN